MNKQEFIEYLLNMGFDWYEEDEHLIFSEIHLEFPNTEDDAEYLFEIYRSFCYPLYDCEEDFSNAVLSVIEEKIKESLEKQFAQAPDCYMEDHYGCPFDDVSIGYHRNEYDTKFVEMFVEICDSTDISEEDDSQIIQNIRETIDARMINYKKDSFSKVNNEYYADNKKQLIVFVGDINELSIIPKDVFLDEITNLIMTAYHFLGKTKSGTVVIVDSNQMMKFYELCDYFNLDKTEFCFYSVGEYIFARGLMNGLIPLQRGYDAEDIANKEYAKLIYKLFALREINSHISIKEFDYSHLSPSEFESLCYDLLQKIGFVDVNRVGKTNAPDGGIDIICCEEYKTITGIERRKWIWQYKHSKKSLDRKDVSEIGDLLEENSAKAYGLFCSNDLTPSAIDRLENKKGDVIISYYGKIEITSLLSKYPDLISKYKLVGRKNSD